MFNNDLRSWLCCHTTSLTVKTRSTIVDLGCEIAPPSTQLPVGGDLYCLRTGSWWINSLRPGNRKGQITCNSALCPLLGYSGGRRGVDPNNRLVMSSKYWYNRRNRILQNTCVENKYQPYFILNTTKPNPIYSIYMDKEDLALHNLQGLICHKTQPN